MFGSVAALSMAGLLAGCSGDVARFDDGFYTGAVPQTVPVQPSPQSQPYPGAVDGTTTGAIAPAGGGYLGGPQPSAYPSSGTMQRGQLPPPSEPTYRSQGSDYRSRQTSDMRSEPVRSAQTSDMRQPEARGSDDRSPAPASRGAPPTTLQQQAAQIATPQSRPSNESRATPPARQETGRGAAGNVTVASGDTLNGIARKAGVSADAIRQANNLDSDTIRLGQTLMIPAGGRMPAAKPAETTQVADAPAARTRAPAKVAEVQTPAKSDVAAKSGRIATPAPALDTTATGSVKQEVQEQVAAVAPNSTGIDQFRWPVQGRVINRYGEKVDGRRNDGVNISVPRGTPVKAAENGVVIYAGDGLKEFGNTVLVKHDNGLVTVYGHADKLSVKKGDDVRRGQVIAQSGMSGDTEIPQLHFEVRKNSTPVDPIKYLQ
ncbi:peptidoglycan DD-metalloendopeptidase family protein [Aurantimonas sp. 22II-16-19i]|uniref:peptidoglycan DD-metalloendopeptidase family protein n=1 Tax=Aurantimonas sp. 22II-16-19i TaxID=1317114 RepID=UPI0009F7C54E|nr:peptidoglycan DD-metalloendopeptidase family protein [Aurantimonas sp. 22II-16-19i]ORE98245.1 M24/M37 family peptidase [Aurantimonas sp. 22II-16-19i]